MAGNPWNDPSLTNEQAAAMEAAAQDDALLDDDGEDQSVETRLAGLSDEEKAALDDGAGIETDDETGAERILTFIERQEAEKLASDEEFKTRWSAYESGLPESQSHQPDGSTYVPPPEDRYQEAAKVAAHLSGEELSAFTQQLMDANLAQEKRLLAGQPGHDDQGEPVAPTEPPFDPSTLSSDAFAAFVRAASSGGASYTDVPAGETFDSWSAKVQSALGR